MIDPTDAAFQGLTPFQQLVQVMAALRAPGGCPWDREQTPRSLTRFLQEESHEAIEAIESGDQGKVCEELGDVLLQVVFQARMAEEEGAFNVEDVCRAITQKMVRRHPHVFGEERLEDAGAVRQRWEQLKQKERGAGASLMDGIPKGLPSLVASERIQSRASEVGFEWPDAASALGKVREELDELEQAMAHETSGRQQEELGDLMFALVSLARQLGVDPEASVRGTCRKFVDRFRALERAAGENLGRLERDELARLWEAGR